MRKPVADGARCRMAVPNRPTESYTVKEPPPLPDALTEKDDKGTAHGANKGVEMGVTAPPIQTQ